jgi:hypothetical protein
MNKRKRKRPDSGSLILLDKGISVERMRNTDDWYVYHTQRTGMWSWTPHVKIAGPVDKKLALEIAKDAEKRAPEPWDGPYDPTTDTVPVAIYAKNPIWQTTRNVLLGISVLGALGAFFYAVNASAKP